MEIEAGASKAAGETRALPEQEGEALVRRRVRGVQVAHAPYQVAVDLGGLRDVAHGEHRRGRLEREAHRLEQHATRGRRAQFDADRKAKHGEVRDDGQHLVHRETVCAPLDEIARVNARARPRAAPAGDDANEVSSTADMSSVTAS